MIDRQKAKEAQETKETKETKEIKPTRKTRRRDPAGRTAKNRGSEKKKRRIKKSMNWVAPIKDDTTLEKFKQKLREVDDKYYIYLR